VKDVIVPELDADMRTLAFNMAIYNTDPTRKFYNALKIWRTRKLKGADKDFVANT
jgi:hypothetical protein